MRRQRYGLMACLMVGATRAAPQDKILVVDIRDAQPVRSDGPTLMAVQVCVGIMNRNDTVVGSAYGIWDQPDLDWLQKIRGISNPTYTSPQDFIQLCLDEVVQGRYIHYDYKTQQALLPNLVTLAGVLDAVPLVENPTSATTAATMVFDAEKEFGGFSPHDATSYMFENYASQTTAMAKMNPGYQYTKKHSLDPPLTGFPHLTSVDFIAKEKLFNIFLPGGCIPLTRDHTLMEKMVQKNQDITSHWEQPIIVYGYDDNDFGTGVGDPFEAETNCVKEHNMGQISTHFVPNLSWFSRMPPITEPLVQNPSPPPGNYNSSKTYIALVMGDGDSFNKLRERNLDWVKQRVAYCKDASRKRNCFPISWTMNQHAAHVAPEQLNWFYEQAKITGQDFFLLPPSGHLYAYPAMMHDNDQDTYVSKTAEGAHLLNTTGTVDWEFSLTWERALHTYYPKLAHNNTMKGVFAVNVPFNIPTFVFADHEFYKIIEGGLVLFKPREWRGASGHTDIPFGGKSYLSEKDMADEINKYPAGTVTYIYVTSDGGATLDNVYNMVGYLEDHVEVVNHEIVTQMALQKSATLGEAGEDFAMGGLHPTDAEDGKGAIASTNQMDSQVLEEPPLIMVLDLRGVDSPTVLAIQVCVGLFNRNEAVAGAAYTVWEDRDLDWLREIESIESPKFTPIGDFLAMCLTTVAKGYIHFNYYKQRVVVPNLVTLAGALDGVPLIETDATLVLIKEANAKMLLHAEQVFDGFSAYDATKYMFEHYARNTTTMSKSDPGYDYSESILHPPLTNSPHLQLADYIVKEKLFNFFLLNGCVSYTKEHSLMQTMTRHGHPNTTQWPQPITVLGYDDVAFGAPGDPFEAETLCVKGHNMGQVATDTASGLSFFSRKPPIDKPLQQNPYPKEEYDEATTYVAFVIGDGDNVGMMKGRNYPWVQHRLAYCGNQSIANNCFPISWTVSPHLLKLAPDLLEWYYEQGKKTGQDYFLLPPSGYLYAYPSLMQEGDQGTFVQKTENAARLLNSSGTVDWECAMTWKRAINKFFPRYARNGVIKGLFAVNVPFNLNVWAFNSDEFYKIIHKNDSADGFVKDDDSAVVLFRPREWRGTSGKSDIPFGKKNNLTEKDMANEISGYPKGTVCYIYLTSDGGADLHSLYKLVPLLGNHVKVVNHEVATDLAVQRSKKMEGPVGSRGHLRHDPRPMDH